METNITTKSTHLAAQPIPFQGTAQDFTLVLACVSPLDFLKEELLRLQGPSIWTVSGSIYVVCRERKIWVPPCGRPGVECERHLRGKILHVLTNLPLCDLCTVNDLGTQSVAVWDVLLGKRWPAKFEETAKGATINQTEGLEQLALEFGKGDALTSSSQMISSIM
jgi:hypothetical protein